jgi:guanine nucleotide-binding protein subunit alpha-15
VARVGAESQNVEPEREGARVDREHRKDFTQLPPHKVSLHSYLSHLERISEDSYIPTAQDVLRSRMPTTGINEYCFSVKKTKLR